MNRVIERNSFWLLVARITAQLFGILFLGIVARKLGVNGFGHFSFIAAIILLGNTFTNFGTDTLLVREISRANQVTELAARSFALQILLSILYCIAMMIYRDLPLIFYSLSLFPLAMYSVNNAVLRAFNRLDLFWLINLLYGILQAVIAFFSTDVLTLCVFLLIGQILVSTFSYIVCYASLPSFRLFPPKDFRPIVRQTLPFAALTILLVLIQRLGVLITSVLMNDAATGLFSAISRVVEGLKIGHYAILGALLPAISRGSPESWRSFRKAFVLLLGISLSFSVALLLFSKPALLILCGTKFTTAARQLSILGWCLIPYTVSSFISYDLIARGLETTLVKSVLISLAIYLILYLYLIPHYGVEGAVWAALVGECLESIVFMIYYKSSSSILKYE